MSQQQFFTGGNSPVIPDIEFIQGTSGGPVGANPVNFTINFTSEDLAIDGTPVSFTQHFVDLVKWTPYVVDNVEPAPYTTIQSALDMFSTYQNVINFNIDFVALNSILSTVDSVPLTPVVFTVNQATTIAAVASMIATATDVVSATVTGARQITVVFAPGVSHVVNSVVTTLGVSQPTATISSSSSASGELVLVRYGSGNYAENLVLPSNVTILSTLEDSYSSVPVLITGTHTPPLSGFVGFVNLRLDDATAILSSSAAGTTNIYFKNCNFGVTNGFDADLTAWTGTLDFIDCSFSGVDDGIVNNSSGTAVINFVNSIIGGGGQLLTSGGFIYAKDSTINCKSNLVGSCSINYTDTYSQSITFTATSNGSFIGGKVSGSGVPSITQSSTGTIGLVNVAIDSNNNPAIAGAGVGVITLAGVPFLNNKIISGTLTTAAYDWKPYGTAGVTATAIRGTAAFDSNDFTVVDGFVDIKGSANGTGQTIGAVTADILTIPLGAVAGTQQFEARVKGFESTTPAGCGYNVYGTLITDGVTATLVGVQDVFNEDPALVTADAYFIASGNNAVLQVLGVAGLTIDWTASTQET